MQKHKNDLIFKLEGKTSAMAETLRKLDDKYVDFSLMSCFKINIFIIYTTKIILTIKENPILWGIFWTTVEVDFNGHQSKNQNMFLFDKVSGPLFFF